MTASTAPARPRAELDSGIIEGVHEAASEAFKGIRFATAPIGEFRWRAPRPVASWTGVRDATRFGADPMQDPFADDMAPLETEPSEDCLFVNVWRPAGTRAGARLPVLVWLYGGGFVNGGTSPAVYHGNAFAQQGIVFVSCNYRVGHFGFFAHPALTRADDDEGLLANYGHMDQLAALRWVQRNIDALGGDSGRVTLVGESAGGGSVVGLMTSPEATGLLHKVIVMSGGGRGLLDGNRRLNEDQPGLPSGHVMGLRVARQHGIDGEGPSALAALRALPAQVLARGLNLATPNARRDLFGGQMLDGRILRDPGAAIAAGRWAKIPVMVGTTEEEVGGFSAESKTDAWQSFGTNAAAARRAFDPDGNAGLDVVRARIGMNVKMHEPARHLARLVSAQGLPVHLYRFSYVAESMRGDWSRGAPHASEIPYFLGRLPARYGAAATTTDRRVADVVHGYVANFVRCDDPNGPGLPRWDPFDAGADTLMTVGADGECRVEADELKARLDLVSAMVDPAPPSTRPT
jgi:para-nitrobenzyl esterase